MPLSAYDEEGRLKKHALRGTGLGAAQDAKGKVQRSQFQTLHDEAKSRGLSEEEMTDTLQSRAETYGGQQQSRLSQIADQRGAMEDRYAATQDLDMERNFALYAGGGGIARTDEFDTEARAAWAEQGGAAGEYTQGDLKKKGSFAYNKKANRDYFRGDLSKKDITRLEKNFLKDSPDLYTQTDLSEYRGDLGGKNDRTSRLRKTARREIESRNKKSLETFRADRWESLYDWKAEKAYNERRSAVETEIDKTYIGLGVESEERHALIADKLELYNMFLGE